MDDEKLLDIKGLYTQYDTDDDIVYAVNNLSLSLNKGRTLALLVKQAQAKQQHALVYLDCFQIKLAK